MRWDALFSDFEGQMNAARDNDWRAEVAERTRGERAAVELFARLIASRGQHVHVTLTDSANVAGDLVDCAHSWALISDEAARQHLIPATAIVIVRGAEPVAHHLSEIDRRLDLTHTLRALSRDRARVRVRTRGGEVHGVIAAVHADHIDVAGEPQARASVPLGQIIEVVSA